MLIGQPAQILEDQFQDFVFSLVIPLYPGNAKSNKWAEYEYRAMATVTNELVWLLALLRPFDLDHNHPASLYCDSKAALYIAANPVFHKCTKHIEVDCHYIRSKIQDGVIKTFHVPTRHQIADFFTKALGYKQFYFLLSKMNMINIYGSSWGGVLKQLNTDIEATKLQSL